MMDFHGPGWTSFPYKNKLVQNSIDKSRQKRGRNMTKKGTGREIVGRNIKMS